MSENEIITPETFNLYGTETISPEILNSIEMGLTFLLIFSLIVTVINIISYWKIFKKSGKHGWAALIPIYNMVVLYKVAKINPLLLILYFIPIVNFVAILVLGVLQSVNVSKVFGKSAVYTLGLLFLPVIFYPILAFGKAKYQA